MGEPWQGGTAEGLTHAVQQTSEVRQPCTMGREERASEPSSPSREETGGRG